MSDTYVPPEPHSHMDLPSEIVRSNMVMWVPASLISDIAFIFHYEDKINGVILTLLIFLQIFISSKCVDAGLINNTTT